MLKKKKNTAERGEFKQKIHYALYKSNDIKRLLLGDISTKSSNDIRKEFKDHVKSHLFIDDTVLETGSYIYYDVRMPRLESNIKDCRVIMYAICHRDTLDNYTQDGYYGNRADILSQMIEDCLINDEEISKSLGIGEVSMGSVDIYNGRKFYGCIINFNVPNFR